MEGMLFIQRDRLVDALRHKLLGAVFKVPNDDTPNEVLLEKIGIISQARSDPQKCIQRIVDEILAEADVPLGKVWEAKEKEIDGQRN